MSTPDTGSAQRPLTRRELRELAERQLAASNTTEPHTSSAVPSTAQPLAPQIEQPSRSGSTDTYATQSSATQNTQPAASPVTRRSMYSAQPPREVPLVIPPSQASAVRTIDETGKLSKLADPKDFEPSATSKLSNDARAENSARVAHLSNPDASAGSRNNLTGYLRQAPPSNQIPKLEEDAHGVWRASSPASAQTRLERAQEQARVLPTWDASSSPFAEFAQQTQSANTTAQFTPEQSFGTSGLPHRAGADSPSESTHAHVSSQATPQRSLAKEPNAPVAPQANGPLSGPFAATASNDQTSVMPAWDAITDPHSTLPQDPTGHGVFAPGIGSATQPKAVNPTPLAPTQPSALAPQSQKLNRPVDSPLGLPLGQPLGQAANQPLGQPTSEALGTPSASATGSVHSVPTQPSVGVNSVGVNPSRTNPTGMNPTGTNPSGISPLGASAAQGQGFQPIGSANLEDELDDDEDFEVDHSYTWLHYIILIAVAFVLGMIIWKVGLDNGSQPAEPESHTFSYVDDTPLT